VLEPASGVSVMTKRHRVACRAAASELGQPRPRQKPRGNRGRAPSALAACGLLESRARVRFARPLSSAGRRRGKSAA